jgi:predicted aminopeptidase
LNNKLKYCKKSFFRRNNLTLPDTKCYLFNNKIYEDIIKNIMTKFNINTVNTVKTAGSKRKINAKTKRNNKRKYKTNKKNKKSKTNKTSKLSLLQKG